MATPLLEARDISKRFGRLQALHHVSIALPRGQTLALVGDNGAGKSTLIKILAGVHQPDSGEIWFEHRRVHLGSPTQARRLGIETVYQDLALVESMSIARNFFLGAEPARRVGPVSVLDTAKMHRTAESYLREIGITSLTTAEKEIRLLSGGERQAISIARAMYFGEGDDPRRTHIPALHQGGPQGPGLNPRCHRAGALHHLHHAQPVPCVPRRRRHRRVVSRPEGWRVLERRRRSECHRVADRQGRR